MLLPLPASASASNDSTSSRILIGLFTLDEEADPDDRGKKEARRARAAPLVAVRSWPDWRGRPGFRAREASAQTRTREIRGAPEMLENNAIRGAECRKQNIMRITVARVRAKR